MLLGPHARGLSAKTVTRLKTAWREDGEAWKKRDLGARRFLCIRADGACFKPRMAGEKSCVRGIVGADDYGHEELRAMTEGLRESTRSWRELLPDLKSRGPKQDPNLAIGDGTLGFRAALRAVFPATREQGCRVRKTMNVPDVLPKSAQSKARAHLHDIWQAETRAAASAAFDFLVEACGVKRDQAAARLAKDRDALPTFCGFPAEHRKTHPHVEPDRESGALPPPSDTVRHRAKRTRGCPGRETGLAMVFRLVMSARANWRGLDGRNRLPEVVSGVEFRDGARQMQASARSRVTNFRACLLSIYPPPDGLAPPFAGVLACCDACSGR